MTIEETVTLIQAGRKDLYLDLWEKVRRFVAVIATDKLSCRGYDNARGHGGVDREDLMQAGFIAMTRAAETFKPGRAKFLSWLKYHLQDEFASAMGYRTSKCDALDSAISLSRPVDEDRTIEDRVRGMRTAPDCADIVDRQIYLLELHEALERAIDEIPAKQAAAIRKTFFDNKSLDEAGQDLGVSSQRAGVLRDNGLRALNGNQGLREFLKEDLNYYTGTGLSTFKRTGQSSTERLAFLLISIDALRSSLNEKYFSEKTQGKNVCSIPGPR